MEIHILLVGVEFGPYTDSQVRQLVEDGSLSLSDPAKRTGDDEWIPLGELLSSPGNEDIKKEPAKRMTPPAERLQSKARDEKFKISPKALVFEDKLPGRTERERPRDVEHFLSTWEKAPHSSVITEQSPPVIEEDESSSEIQVEQELAAETSHEFRNQWESIAENSGPVTKEVPVAVGNNPPPPVKPSSVKQISVPAPSFPQSAAAPSAPPMIHVSLPFKAKGPGTMRTGSLLAKEALNAARARASGSLLSINSETTMGDVPSIETPTRPKIILRDRQDTTPLPAPGRTIAKKPVRLTQSLVGTKVVPNEQTELKKPASRVGTGKTGKILLGQITRPSLLSDRPVETPLAAAPLPPTVPEPNIETFSTSGPVALATDPGEQPTSAISEPLTEGKPTASETSTLTSSGELSDRRSLKITGALRHSTPRIPLRLRPSSPYVPGDSGRLVSPSSEQPEIERPPVKSITSESKLWPPERPAAVPSSRVQIPDGPVEGPDWDARPPSGKIPVSEMPHEGLKIRTRRPTTKIPVAVLPGPPVDLRAPTPTLPSTNPEIKTDAMAPSTLEMKSVPIPDVPGSVTTGPSSGPVTELPAAEALASTPEKPDKVRLRRPVKLELSSRAKVQESGKLTLEAFSKIAVPPPASEAVVLQTFGPGVDAKGEPTPPPPALENDVSLEKETALSAVETSKVIPAVATVEDFLPPRLMEAKPRDLSRLSSRSGKPSWLWLAYLIIVLGVFAAFLILIIAARRTSPSSSPNSKAAVVAPSSAVVSRSLAPAAVVPTAPLAPPAPDVTAQVNAYIAEGIADYQKGSQDVALIAYNHALDLNPKSAEALYNRGLTKAAQEDLDGAVADYSQALLIDPKLSSALYYRGLARHSKGELDGALSDYNSAVQIDPKNPLAFFNRGLIRMQKDDIDGAIVDSGRALELDPRLIQSYYNRGLGRLAKGALDAALSDMRTFCQLAPQDAYTDYARLYIWLIRTQQNQLAEANQELNKSMNSGWNGAADAMVTKIGEFLLGQISENTLITASSSTIPIRDQGQHCEAWYFIGMRLLEAGNKEEGSADLRKCIDTQKTDYCEYILAQEELRALNPGGNATSPVVTPPAPPPTPAPVPVAK